MRCISILRSLHFKTLLTSFLITFLCHEMAIFNRHVPVLLPRILMPAFLLWRFLSVFTCWVRNVVTLTSWHVSTLFWYAIIPTYRV
jgi:hypothetical protein